MAVYLLAGPFAPSVNGSPKTVINVEFVTWWPGVGLLTTGSSFAGYPQLLGVTTFDARYCDRGEVNLNECGWWPAKKMVVKHRVGQWVSDGVDTTIEFQHDPILFVPTPSGPETYPANHPLNLKWYVKLHNRSIFYAPANDHSFQVVVNGVITGSEGPPAIFREGRIHAGRSDTEVFVAERGVDLVTGLISARGVFYDTVTKEWSSPVYTIGMSCDELVYATDFGVLVSRHGTFDPSEPALPPLEGGGGGGGGETPVTSMIMVGSNGPKFYFMTLDGDQPLPQPPSAPVANSPIAIMVRTSEGHIAQQGGMVTKLFKGTDLTVLSTYTGTRAGTGMSADGAGNWYLLKASSNVAPVKLLFTKLNAAAQEVKTWDIAVPGETQPVALAVSADGLTAYCFLTESSGGGHMTIQKFDLSGVGQLVGKLHTTDWDLAPSYQSLFVMPGGDVIASYTKYNGKLGALVRYRTSGTIGWVFEDSRSDTVPIGGPITQWRSITPGPPGDAFFLAWGYEPSLVTVCDARYCWFNAATGQPDRTRAFAPEDGDFRFDGTFVIWTPGA